MSRAVRTAASRALRPRTHQFDGREVVEESYGDEALLADGQLRQQGLQGLPAAVTRLAVLDAVPIGDA
jgi:hypothetical protein